MTDNKAGGFVRSSMVGIIHIIIQVLTQRDESKAVGVTDQVDGSKSMTGYEVNPNLESVWCSLRRGVQHIVFSLIAHVQDQTKYKRRGRNEPDGVCLKWINTSSQCTANETLSPRSQPVEIKLRAKSRHLARCLTKLMDQRAEAQHMKPIYFNGCRASPLHRHGRVFQSARARTHKTHWKRNLKCGGIPISSPLAPQQRWARRANL